MAAAIAALESAAAHTNKNALDSNAGTQLCVQNLVDLFTKLNPSAKEFFPSRRSDKRSPDRGYYANSPSFSCNGSFVIGEVPVSDEKFGRRRGEFDQGRKRFSGRAYRARSEDNVRRTVYVSDIDQLVTEEILANMFSLCGQMSFNLQQVLDIWGFSIAESVGTRIQFFALPLSSLQMKAITDGARAALSFGGMVLGYYPVRVLPSKTAILPVNPSYLPKVSQTDVKSFFFLVGNVKSFFETACGKVTHLRLLGDQLHSTRIAFVEFSLAENAIAALSCSGMVLGTQPVRISPSKTPVRPRDNRPSEN